MAEILSCDCNSILQSIEELRQKINELEAMIASGSSGKTKRKRAPSKYNIFMKECLARKKNESGTHQDKFKACALEYKKRR